MDVMMNLKSKELNAIKYHFKEKSKFKVREKEYLALNAYMTLALNCKMLMIALFVRNLD